MSLFEDPARHRALIRELCKDIGRECLRASMTSDKEGIHVTVTHSLGPAAEEAAGRLIVAMFEAAFEAAAARDRGEVEP